jgi:hypothetical protein
MVPILWVLDFGFWVLGFGFLVFGFWFGFGFWFELPRGDSSPANSRRKSSKKSLLSGGA